MGAREAFAKAIKDGTTAETLIAGARRYAIERKGQDPTYSKHPATWLNRGCYDDELDGPPVIDQAGNLVAIEPPPPRPQNGYDRSAERRALAEQLKRELCGQAEEEAGDGYLH